MAIVDQILAALKNPMRRPRVGRADHQKTFFEPLADDHPLGEQLSTPKRSSIARRAKHFGAGLPGLLDARRHVRRGNGLHLRSPHRKAEAQQASSQKMMTTQRQQS